jgi:protein O-GlcNAc transferase
MSGPMMRGCHTTGVLRMMDVTETITNTVEDYISVAVRLARDPGWHSAIRTRMIANKHRVYHDEACIVALQDFLDRAVRTEPH